MTQYNIQANEGHYIACVSDFKNINQLKQQLTNLLLSAYDQKWLAVIMDPVTVHINKQLPLIFYLLYTNYGQITPTALNPKTRRMYKSHLQYQRTHIPDMGPNNQQPPGGTGSKIPIHK